MKGKFSASDIANERFVYIAMKSALMVREKRMRLMCKDVNIAIFSAIPSVVFLLSSCENALCHTPVLWTHFHSLRSSEH